MSSTDNSADRKAEESVQQAPLIRHEFYVRHDKKLDRMVTIDDPSKDPDHIYDKGTYYQMNVLDIHPGFATIKKTAEHSPTWGIRGIVTRDGTVVFDSTGKHGSFAALFDMNRLLDFYDQHIITENTWKLSINNSSDIGKVPNSKLPTYAEAMLAIAFFVHNLLLNNPDNEDVVLDCSIRVIGSDNKTSIIGESWTCGKWKSYFETNDVFLQKLKELTPPFQST